MLALLILLVLLALLFGGYGHGSGWGYYGWSPLALLIVVVLVLWLVGAVHAEPLQGNIAWDHYANIPWDHYANIPWDRSANIPWDHYAFGVPLAFGMATRRDPYDDDGRTGPPGLPFTVAYWLGVILTVVLAGIGFIQTQFAAGHGADFGLTPQVFAWLSVVASMLGVLARLFPNLQHTPKFRRRELYQARRGLMPPDLHRSDRPGGEPAGP